DLAEVHERDDHLLLSVAVGGFRPGLHVPLELLLPLVTAADRLACVGAGGSVVHDLVSDLGVGEVLADDLRPGPRWQLAESTGSPVGVLDDRGLFGRIYLVLDHVVDLTEDQLWPTRVDLVVPCAVEDADVLFALADSLRECPASDAGIHLFP